MTWAWVMAFGVMAAGNIMAEQHDSNYLSAPGGAWRLALADVDHDGQNEVLYGAYDGAVRCLDPRTDTIRWEHQTGGFPFSVKAYAVGKQVWILAACADGRLYALDAKGGLRWKYNISQPLYDTVMIRAGGTQYAVCGGPDAKVRVLDMKGKAVCAHTLTDLAHRLTGADVDGDGDDEIIALDNRHRAVTLKLENRRLRVVHDAELTVPSHVRNWENPYSLFAMLSVEAGDLNGDGRVELVGGDDFHNRQRVGVFELEGNIQWLSRPLRRVDARFYPKREAFYEFYAGTFVRIVREFPGVDGPVILALSGGSVRLFAPDGKRLAQTESRLGFADLIVDGHTLYLGSTPNGDDTLYRIHLNDDWQKSIYQLERRGRAAEVAHNLAGLCKQVLAAEPLSTSPVPSHVQWNFWGSNERRMQLFGWLNEQFPYSHLRFIHHSGVIEDTPPLNSDGEPWNPERWKTDTISGTMTVDEILARVRYFEEQKRPTIFGVGHSCMPFITLDTAEQMLNAGPKYLLGFQSAEDEQPEVVARYMEEFIGPLADLCYRHGKKKVIEKNKGVWWMSMPAHARTFAALTKGHRPETIIAATEDSNSRTPEINLMARVGLRQAGVIDRFQISVHTDLFSYNRFHQWEYPKSGHPYVRLLTAQTVLGGDPYRLFGPFVNFHSNNLHFTTYGKESAEIFLHLLGRGLIVSPAPEQMAGLSTVGIAVHAPPEKWLRDAHNGHEPSRWKDDPELHHAVIPHNGCNWGNSPTPEHALSYVLFNKRRQFGCFVPPTPYGVVAIVPAHADLDRVIGVNEWWHTDGIYLWRKREKKMTGKAAAEALRASFEKAAEKLPFRLFGDDVFFHSIRMDDGVYRLYAVDPGWLDPEDRQVEVAVQLPGAWRIRDLLSGGDIPVTDGRFALSVPAGALRILEAQR